ncbi:MAG: hypothetical protein FRX48_03761 [Lasallia pustulata]|uniref:Ubiquitin 3 binding protein But2 C-terminal domain-containing protein n=1 Tax=Lasallia pustulata TaxID=136370 RepID=A0A5M8PUQ2_9LECA|nr:MAG: hypothetical protein FRX48_03761 [Lasallia pustulata]
MLFISRLSSALTLALAIAGLTSADPTPTLQPWQITAMDINGPGPINIPGATGTSPANVTISFTFFDPNSNRSTTCGATYLPANYPTALSQIHCADYAVTFYFTPPYTFFGGNFTLDVEFIDSPAAVPTAYAGSVYVLDNNYTSPANYLSCYGGAPYAGLTCTQLKTIPVPITSAT